LKGLFHTAVKVTLVLWCAWSLAAQDQGVVRVVVRYSSIDNKSGQDGKENGRTKVVHRGVFSTLFMEDGSQRSGQPADRRNKRYLRIGGLGRVVKALEENKKGGCEKGR
jgi:hypothetical protein